MADPNYLSYVVPGTSDQPGGYQELLARKAIAEALAKKREFPKNIGEGIFSASESLANAIGQRDALDAGRRYLASGTRTLGDIPDNPGGGRPPITYEGGDSAPPAPAPTPAPAPAGPSPWTADNEGAVREGSLFGQSALTPYAVEDAAPAPVSHYAPAGTAPGQATTARDQITAALLKQRFASAFGDTAPAGEGGSVPFNGAPVSTGAPSNLPVVAQDDEGNPPIRTDIPAAPAGDNLLTQAVPTTKPLTVARQPNPIQPLPLYPEQRKALAILASPDWGPDVKEAAKRKFDIWEKYREEQQALMHAEFTRAQKEADEYDKAQRTVDLKDFQERQTALQTQQKNVLGQNEISQLPITNLKGFYEAQNQRKTYETPIQQVINGQIWQYDRASQTWAPAPGSPVQNLTDKQQEAVNFATQALPDLKELDEKLDYGAPLTDRYDRFLDKYVPIYGHQWASQAYRSAEQKMGAFAGAFMRMRSGGAVTDSEAARNLPSITPEPGDSHDDLVEKAKRRRMIVEGSLAGAGPEARARADAAAQQLEAEFHANRARSADGKPPIKTFSETAGPQPVLVHTPDEARALPAGTPIILPDGRTGTSPGPKQQAGP